MIQELKKQGNDSGYYSVANNILLIFRDYCELPVLENYLFWKKTLYSSGSILRYAFLDFVDVVNKNLLIFQFSCDEKEILRYGAVYYIGVKKDTQLSLIEGWCYLVKDGRPYGISKTEIEYIDEYLKEIKPELLEVMS